MSLQQTTPSLTMIKQKMALNLKLKGSELRVWEEYLNAQYRKTESYSLDSNGNLVVKKSLDAQPIVDAVQMSSDIQAPVRNDRGMLHLGSIDQLTANNWAKECGAAVGTKEFAAYAKKKLQSGEYAKFRVKRKRRYV